MPMKKTIALLLAAVMLLSLLAACSKTEAPAQEETPAEEPEAPAQEETPAEEPEQPAEEQPSQEELDQEAADNVAALIDAIYVQERTDDTDAQCEAAEAAWDALTDAQKELVEGEEASPEYFGRDTGDASLDDARNQDEIGENELLVVSFGTSFNDSRVADIKGIEDALQAAYPDWSVRRAFTAQIIINHIQARDGEKIDNMTQALDRAVANGVKNLVVQPTHLMHGAEYDEMCEAIEAYKDQFESVSIAEPMLGEVGSDATVINADKEAVAKAITAAAVSEAGFESLEAAKDAGTAFVFMGHGTAHVAKVTYSQMQAQMQNLGYENVFIGTVEGEPEETSAEAVIEAVKAAGYTNVVLRPLMVVAGDHANNDMAGSDDDSWKTMFEAAGFTVDCQIHGLGEIADVQALYVAHTKAAIDALNA
ncbi:MAG: sirohydrochlorin cobaltochelatase [Oscillospiraceae bacterium]